MSNTMTTKERELRFVSWPDGRLSIIKRRYERDYDTKQTILEQSINVDTYSKDETKLLREALNESTYAESFVPGLK